MADETSLLINKEVPMDELNKISVILTREALSALRQLAYQERRDPKLQATWLIERELERRGLLTPEDPKTSAKQPAAVNGK